MREGVTFHESHVVNTICTSLTEAADQKTSLLIGRLLGYRLIVGKVPCWLVLALLHGATWMNEEVVVHVLGGKDFAGKVDDPITEIVMTSHYEAALIATQGMTDV